MVAVKYTQTQFDAVICSLDTCYGNTASQVAKSSMYGFECSQDLDVLLTKLFLFRWALDDWQQHAGGSTAGYTNPLTQEELTGIVEKVKDLCSTVC